MAARVLVTDASRGSAVAIIRSLGRHGYAVVAADSLRRSPGFYSRYAEARVLYPSPTEAPEAVVETLLGAARELAVDLIVPVTDEVILPLARARERFDGVCALAIPAQPALETASDKLATVELARTHGVPVPATVLVRQTAEARDAAAELGWPVVLKPRFSRVYHGGAVAAYGVAYAADEAQLAAELGRLEGESDVLLQEYRQGTGYGVELLLDRGHPLAAFQHRRLREVPITGGASSFRESAPLDPVLLEHSLVVLGALEWTGLAMVEFKVGDRGSALMEVNGRIWGSLPLAVRSGVDFPRRLAELYLDGPPADGAEPDTDYPLGVRSRNLELEVAWIGSALRRRRYPFLEAPSRRAALRVALALLDPADGYDILSRDDPRPGVAELRKIAGKLPGKLRRG